MQKPAHLGSLATRLNNLEQKFDESGGGGGDEGLYDLVLAGSEHGGIPSGPTIYEHFETSLFKSIFGLAQSGQPSFGALVSAQYNPFYSQVFGGSGGYFIDVGGGLNPDGDPAVAFSDAVFFGVPPVDLGGYSLAYILTGGATGYIEPLGFDLGETLPRAIYGTPLAAEEVRTDHGSVVSYIRHLENRIDSLSSRVAALEAA